MKLIKIDGYWIIVEDKRIENPTTNDLILDEYNQIAKFVDLSFIGLGYGNFKKVLFSQNPEHNLHSITFNEEVSKELGIVDVEKLKRNYTAKRYENSDNKAWFNQRACEIDFKGGYNQCLSDNKDKLFTLEQLKQAIFLGQMSIANPKGRDFGDNFESTCENIIQSLTKQEYEVELEMNSPYFDTEYQEEMHRNPSEIEPLIINNSVKVIKLLK